MSRSPCAHLAELRSAYVDGALEPSARDRLLSHLAQCAACRTDVAELRAVRDLLHRSADPAGAGSADLSRRLVLIAGDEAALPLWTRPFRRTPAGGLPSRRRVRHRRLGAGVAAGAAALSLLALIGYGIAPPSTLAEVADPGLDARAAFSTSLQQSPLAADVLSAVMMADPVELTTTQEVDDAPGVTPARGGSLSAAEAQGALVRAAQLSAALSYHGRQSFVSHRGGRTLIATAQVTRTSQGVGVWLFGVQGRELFSGFSPAAPAARMPAPDLASVLRGYTFRGDRGGTVAGRDATVVEATRVGATVARWWIDTATGLVLWQQDLAPTGAVQQSFGFTALTLQPGDGIIGHLPPPLTASTTTTALTLSSVGPLSASGWVCEPDMAGLSLVRLRSNEPTAPAAVHLVYTDGLHTLSVLEQRGRMTTVPADTAWVPGAAAYVRHGAAELAVWQSGGTVFTVMTDGSEDLLGAAVAALPHDQPIRRTTMERVHAGWAKILADMKG